jgi:hypothetical protein
MPKPTLTAQHYEKWKCISENLHVDLSNMIFNVSNIATTIVGFKQRNRKER